MALLEVKDLKTVYHTRDGIVKAVDGISLKVEDGETVGLVGESGCGKSTVALSLLKLLPPGGSVDSGEIRFRGRDILQMNEDQLRKIRGQEISIAFQGAMNALNPVKTIKEQIVESILLHETMDRTNAEQKAAELYSQVGINPKRIKDYPHQLSGGMKQRAMIAMALSSDPLLLIADEPVTALDVMVQAQILELIKKLSKTRYLSILLITHDLSVVAETCDRIIVMYAGKVVESAPTGGSFQHPYTKCLFQAFPNINKAKEFVRGIPGAPPDLKNYFEGCRFYPRCNESLEICNQKEPTIEKIREDQFVACHLARE